MTGDAHFVDTGPSGRMSELGQKVKFRSDQRMSALRPKASHIYEDTPLEHVGQGLPVQVDIQALHAEIADFAAHRLQALLADQRHQAAPEA
jgi:hypothetical protein